MNEHFKSESENSRTEMKTEGAKLSISQDFLGVSWIVASTGIAWNLGKTGVLTL